ncbi:hypothetical protein AB0N28_04180 [Streptomyces sp. NPDC051130]|uniref:hypothetical protein n=1 Tax=Streptomyces sp. NPDC051130 TaxID=3157223 RepID=UPI003423CC16
MTARGMRGQMLRIGRTAGRSSHGGHTRFLALLFATLSLSLAATAFVAAWATYDGRESRGAARAPLSAVDGQEGKVLFGRYWDQYRGRQFSVNIIVPLTPDAPLPPGLRSWPEPGTAVISPALAEGPASEDFQHRWGDPGGIIGAEGLASPGERFVYVRPTEEMARTAKLVPVTSFGGPSGGAGDLQIVQPAWEIHTLIAVLLAAPAFTFAFLAARTASTSRDRRDALLRTLGAGPVARLWMDAGSVLVPVAVGGLLGTAAAATLMTGDLRLPWIDYLLSAQDMRAAAPTLLGAALAAAPLMYLIIALQRPLAARRSRSTRPTAARGGFQRKLAVALFPALVLLVFTAQSLLGDRRRGTLLYLASVTAVWILLPSVLGWLFLRLAPRLTLAARKSGDPARLIAVRTLTARPAGLIRLVASLVIGVGLIGQAGVIGSSMASISGNLDQLDSTSGQTMAAIQASARAHLDGPFLRQLPTGAHVVSYGHTQDSSARIIQAPCPDLQAMGLPCPATGTQAEVAYGNLDERFRSLNFLFFGPTSAIVRTGPLEKVEPNGTLWLAIFNAPDQPLDVPAVKRTAHRDLSAKANILTLAEASGSSFDLAYQSRWVPFLSVLGTLILVGSILAAAFAEFLDVGRALAPLAILSGDQRIFQRAAAWFLGVPLITAGLIGIAAYVGLSLPALDAAQGITISGPLVAAVVLGTLVTALAAWWGGGRTASALASTWRPKAD